MILPVSYKIWMIHIRWVSIYFLIFSVIKWKWKTSKKYSFFFFIYFGKKQKNVFVTLPENNYTTKKANKEDDSMSATDSDRIALLKLLKNRKRLKKNNPNDSMNMKTISHALCHAITLTQQGIQISNVRGPVRAHSGNVVFKGGGVFEYCFCYAILGHFCMVNVFFC